MRDIDVYVHREREKVRDLTYIQMHTYIQNSCIHTYNMHTYIYQSGGRGQRSRGEERADQQERP
jgi:hypothetical protein